MQSKVIYCRLKIVLRNHTIKKPDVELSLGIEFLRGNEYPFCNIHSQALDEPGYATERIAKSNRRRWHSHTASLNTNTKVTTHRKLDPTAKHIAVKRADGGNLQSSQQTRNTLKSVVIHLPTA